ncbi:hypothetical protein [Pseudomonas sp. OV226]|uniref:hypothetical protein n=1 Tax=Pseudomonas sp. OV226 TaxID=2135588 RepID=UPI000D6C3808|nr:hypothetical protein [Pseudomonas sp. OV226]PWK45954.1 hypothetical protein C7534_101555 [Pseudomonas sp. OV226]
MTIVAFHYTSDDLFAISDGLISRGDARVTEENKKILSFKTCYKIPKISLGRLNYFSEYLGGDFYLAYAGNYTLISNIVNEFTAITSRKLVLYRDQVSGAPTVYQREDEGEGLRSRSYWDDFNFTDSELVPVTINFLANILERVMRSCAQDFARNAMQNPDVELILFGEQIVHYRRSTGAQVLKCKGLSDGAPTIERFSVMPWSLVCIGDPVVIPEAVSAIERDSEFTVPISVINESGIQFEKEQAESLHVFLRKRLNVIKKNIIPLILKNAGSIGGSCTIAQSGWASRVEMTTFKNEQLEFELSKLLD